MENIEYKNIINFINEITNNEDKENISITYKLLINELNDRLQWFRKNNIRRI